MPEGELPCHQGGVKRQVRRYRLVGIGMTLVVGSWLIVTACSNYGQGERCETGNNSEDCSQEEGLVCTRVEELAPGFNNPQTQGDRCCPRDRNQATAAPCKFPTEDAGVFGPPGESEGGADADAGALPDADAGSDADPDADAGDAGDAGDAADADGG